MPTWQLVQLPVVAGLAVQQVVDALGDGKEVLVALDHHPAGIDPRASQVAEQEVQHLGDPTALLGRVDLPQPSAGKPIGRLRQPVQEAAAVVGVKHGLEPSRVKAGYPNVLQGHLPPSTSQSNRAPSRPPGGVARSPQQQAATPLCRPKTRSPRSASLLPAPTTPGPARWSSRLPASATLVPPARPLLVLDLDLLLADLLGHPLLVGHGVLVQPDPLPGHDPLLDHRLLLTEDHLMLSLRDRRARGGRVAVGVGDRLTLNPDPLPLDRNGLLDLLGGDVLPQPDPAPLALGGADPQLLLRAGHGVIGPRPRGVSPDRVSAGPAPPGGAVVVEAVVAPQLPLLDLRQAPVRVDSWGVFDQLLVVGTRTSWSVWVAWARGTKLALVPNRPVLTRAHSGWPVWSSR